MTHVLVTFLGAPDTGRPPSLRKRRGYQVMHYRFPPDGHIRRHRLFPLALLAHLRRGGGGPSELVVFGTRGSVWDELLRYAGGHWSQRELNDLIELALKNGVDQDVLKRYQDPLRDVLGLDSVRLEVLEHLDEEDAGGSTGDEVQKQIEIIERLNKATEKATKITIDVTHGLRYMPLLGSLAAYVVESTRSSVFVKPEMVAKIDGIWYGALDRKKPDNLGQEIAPAINLAGLSRIVDWLTAFKNFEWDGDYWAFAEALEHEDKATAGALAEAAFLDRLGRIEQADEKFREVRDAIAGAPKQAVTGLFGSALKDRFAVLDMTSDQLFHHQRALALHHLEHDDLVHAAIWGREAAVTRIVPAMRLEFESSVQRMPDSNSRESKKKRRFQAYVDVDNINKFVRIHEVRQKCAHLYGCKSMSGVAEDISSQHKEFLRIRRIRNAFAHGVSEMEDDNQPIDNDGLPEIHSFDACKAALTKSLNSFLDEKDPKGANLITSLL